MSDASGNSGPGSGHDGPGRWAAVRGMLLATGCVLVAGATFVALLTDDPRWLKGSVLAAGWACALALIASARPRTEDGDWDHDRVQELRRSYELEVEREVAARREYELQLEVRLRRDLDADAGAKVAELRAEVAALRAELNARPDPALSLRRVEVHSETVRADVADTMVGMSPVAPAARPVRREADLLAQHGGASWDTPGPRRPAAGTATPGRSTPAAEEILAEALEPFGLSDTGSYRGPANYGGEPSRRPDPHPETRARLGQVERDPFPRVEPEPESTSGRHAVVDPTAPPGQRNTTSRRRRRYREDDEENEVLNRVMRDH